MCLIYIYENERNKNRKDKKKNREDDKAPILLSHGKICLKKKVQVIDFCFNSV